MHGSYKEEWSGLRPVAVSARAGVFSFLRCSWRWQWSGGHGAQATWVVGLGPCPVLAPLLFCTAPSGLLGCMTPDSSGGLLGPPCASVCAHRHCCFCYCCLWGPGCRLPSPQCLKPPSLETIGGAETWGTGTWGLLSSPCAWCF
jgi:hypothetical protein